MNSRPKASREEILRYLDEHGVVDKDRQNARALKTGRDHAIAKKRATRQTLDLHGKTVAQAAAMLPAAIARCSANGIRELLVVHGQGLHSDPNEGPVLKQAVAALLASELQGEIRDFRTAARRDGGEGATIVRLR
jgi:DNA-nicking Smr family endonuclease